MSYELGLRCVPEILRFALDDNPGFHVARSVPTCGCFQRCTQRPYFGPYISSYISLSVDSFVFFSIKSVMTCSVISTAPQ